MVKIFLAFLGLSLLVLPGFQATEAPKMLLSDFGFFSGKLADLTPAEGVWPYDLNSPLFSDYAWKSRFVKLPAGTRAGFAPKEVFDFPEGTVLIKNFFYPLDFKQPEKGRKILETRLLIHEPKGWKALTYVWNDEQTEANLEVAGDSKPVSWKDENGHFHQISYSIPNVNQCKSCHSRSGKMVPIGPSARQLNRDFDYPGGTSNQLQKWSEVGLIDSLPDLKTIEKTATVADPNIESAARAYLDINCGHCHHPEGMANTSGLFLHAEETNPTSIGILKSPIAAGRGAGNRQFNIVPGKPDASILLYRMESDDPGVRMPETGRFLAHQEGIALIRKWIESL